jgi:hypothetical protein
VMGELSFDQAAVLQCAGAPAARRRPDSTSAEGARLAREVARRRESGHGSVLAIPAAPGMPPAGGAQQLLEEVAPDYVLAAVGAHSKRLDVEHLIGALPRVDALALWGLVGTRTPGELLGLLPIAFVDGEVSSALGWTLRLAGLAMERSR